MTDTPGLLPRPDDFRNKMELLTLAALDHLPSSVMFVFDLTEECGTSVSDQWAIRQEVKERYPEKFWVDVFSKADLLEEVLGGSVEQQQGHGQKQQEQEQEEQRQQQQHGVQVQGQQHEGSLGNSGSEEQTGSYQGEGEVGSGSNGSSRTGVEKEEVIGTAAAAGLSVELHIEAETPAAVAAALPKAVKVSSLTEEGMDELKIALMKMLSGS